MACPRCWWCSCPNKSPCICTKEQLQDFYRSKVGTDNKSITPNIDPWKIPQYNVFSKAWVPLTPMYIKKWENREQVDQSQQGQSQ